MSVCVYMCGCVCVEGGGRDRETPEDSVCEKLRYMCGCVCVDGGERDRETPEDRECVSSYVTCVAVCLERGGGEEIMQRRGGRNYVEGEEIM